MLLALLLSCADEPLPLPAEAAAEALDREALPPLYRKLYDYAFLPEVQASEQRVRLLIWLKYMDFDRYQLGLLAELATRADREREDVARVQQEILARQEPQVGAVYDQLWAALDRDAPEAELAGLAASLDVTRVREAELVSLRARSIRTLLDAEEPLLHTLTPRQEALLADATFLLRHKLDPYANPGDFTALIGTVYQPGEYGSLSRSTFDPNEDHLDLGGLWSPAGPARQQAHFPDAKREVVVYMVLLEPQLPEAIAAALQIRQRRGVVESPGPGRPGGVP